MGKKKGKEKEKQRKRVSAERVYNGFYRWNHQRIHSFVDSEGESVTSLYGYLGLYPSVIPSVKSSEKNPHHHTVATFQTNCIGCQQYDRYIPTDVFRRYIPTELETELFPSIRITDEKIMSIILLVFTSFLVVLQRHWVGVRFL
jgi:hypothetical protein